MKGACCRCNGGDYSTGRCCEPDGWARQLHEEVDAASAWFVRSQVVTNPVTGNRVHAFRNPDDARRHAEAFGGVLLSGAERPFQPEEAPR